MADEADPLRRLRSPVWEYMRRANNIALCNLCPNQLSLGNSSSTSNAIRHLATIHNINLQLPARANEKKVYARLVARVIILDLLPLSFAKSDAVQDLRCWNFPAGPTPLP